MCVLLVYLSHIRDPASGYVGNNGFGNNIHHWDVRTAAGIDSLTPYSPPDYEVYSTRSSNKMQGPSCYSIFCHAAPPNQSYQHPACKGRAELRTLGHSQKSLGVQPRPSSKWGPTKNAAFASAAPYFCGLRYQLVARRGVLSLGLAFSVFSTLPAFSLLTDLLFKSFFFLG